MTHLLKRLRSVLERAFLLGAASTVPGKQERPTVALLRPRDFSGFREHWWMQWKLEPLHHRLRYLWLMEKARVAATTNERAASPAQALSELRRICVIQFGHLGDLIHTMPMLRALRRQWKDAHVALLTGPWNRAIAQRMAWADKVIYYAPRWDPFVRGHFEECLSLGEEWRFLLSLRDRQFDVAIDATSGSLPSLCCMLAIQPRLGIGPDLFPAKAFGQAPVWYRTVPYASRLYEARRLVNLLEPLDVRDADERLEFPLMQTDCEKARALLKERGVTDGAGYAVIAPGAGWPGKMWPMERFAELART